MIQYSPEQLDVIADAVNGESVMVNAVAGSGKSTTIIGIALKNPNKKCIQLTYNAALKHEMRKKVKELHVTNLDVHSYHSLASSIYKPAPDDSGINYIIVERLPPKITKCYDIIMIDETQDCIRLYYTFMRKFIKDNCTSAIMQILIFGDEYQCVYNFKGSDARYLTLGQHLWNIPMKTRPLSYSYRLTEPTACFINSIMLGENRIVTTKPGKPVDYVYLSKSNSIKHVANYIIHIIRSGECLPSDIFVLAPSVKKNPAVNAIDHLLVDANIPCFIPTENLNKVDDSIIRDKVVFMSCHQVKGGQRDYVIVLDFDSSYFSVYAKDTNPFICPPILYVGTTRPLLKLIVVHDRENRPLPFLKKTLINISRSSCVNFIGDASYKPNQPAKIVAHKIKLNELVKFLRTDTEIICETMCDQLFTEEIKGNKTIFAQTTNSSEFVCDINDIIIPAIFETDNGTKLSTIHKSLLDNQNQIFDPFFRSAYGQLTSKTEHLTTREYTYLTVLYSSLQDNLHYRLAQMQDYNWLSDDMVQQCISIMRQITGPPNMSHYKVPIGYNVDINIINHLLSVHGNTPLLFTFYAPVHAFVSQLFGKHFGKINIVGEINMVQSNIIWTHKCSNKISIEDKLLCVCTAWLWHKLYEPAFGSRVVKLFSIYTGEILILDTTNILAMDEIMKQLLYSKFNKHPTITDADFIEMHSNIYIPPSMATIESNTLFNMLTNHTKNQNILVIDTETTGFSATTDYIVQVSYMCCSIESLFDTNPYIYDNVYDTVVKIPDGVILTDMQTMTSGIHGITCDHSREHGRSLTKVLEDFAAVIKNVSYIVAHNATFDINIIVHALEARKLYHIRDELLSKHIVCTMKSTKRFEMCDNNKCPKLAELFQYTTKNDIEYAHNSKYDVINLHWILKSIAQSPELINKLNPTIFNPRTASRDSIINECRRLGIRGYSALNKSQLVDLYENNKTTNKNTCNN